MNKAAPRTPLTPAPFRFAEMQPYLQQPILLVFEDVGISFPMGFQAVHFSDAGQSSFRLQQRQVKVLDRCSGVVGPGLLCGVMGPSGCGKTVLLDVLCGCASPRCEINGSISVNGKPLRRPLAATRLCAYVRQCDDVPGWMTVQEVARYSAALQLPSSMPRAVRRAATEHVLAALGLAHVKTSLVKDVSGGQRRRVTVAADGLLSEARLLVLDEPLSGLSSTDSERLVRLLRSLADDHAYSIVMTMSQPRASVYDMCDLLMLLGHHRMCFFGPRQVRPSERRRCCSFSCSPPSPPPRTPSPTSRPPASGRASTRPRPGATRARRSSSWTSCRPSPRTPSASTPPSTRPPTTAS